MNKFVAGLLGTTYLTALASHPVIADVIFESNVGSFGQSFAIPTALTPNVTEIVADAQPRFVSASEGLSTAFFQYTGADPTSLFDLRLTVSRVQSEGAGFVGVDSAAGGVLPQFPGNPTFLVQSEGYNLLIVRSEGGSGVTYPSGLQPVLTFYNDAGAVVDSLTLSEGNSFEVTGSALPDGNIDFSVGFDFDFVVDASVPAAASASVPEPESAALLAPGLLGLAALRRRRKGGEPQA